MSGTDQELLGKEAGKRISGQEKKKKIFREEDLNSARQEPTGVQKWGTETEWVRQEKNNSCYSALR